GDCDPVRRKNVSESRKRDPEQPSRFTKNLSRLAIAIARGGNHVSQCRLGCAVRRALPSDCNRLGPDYRFNTSSPPARALRSFRLDNHVADITQALPRIAKNFVAYDHSSSHASAARDAQKSFQSVAGTEAIFGKGRRFRIAFKNHRKIDLTPNCIEQRIFFKPRQVRIVREAVVSGIDETRDRDAKSRDLDALRFRLPLRVKNHIAQVPHKAGWRFTWRREHSIVLHRSAGIDHGDLSPSAAYIHAEREERPIHARPFAIGANPDSVNVTSGANRKSPGVMPRHSARRSAAICTGTISTTGVSASGTPSGHEQNRSLASISPVPITRAFPPMPAISEASATSKSRVAVCVANTIARKAPLTTSTGPCRKCAADIADAGAFATSWNSSVPSETDPSEGPRPSR